MRGRIEPRLAGKYLLPAPCTAAAFDFDMSRGMTLSLSMTELLLHALAHDCVVSQVHSHHWEIILTSKMTKTARQALAVFFSASPKKKYVCTQIDLTASTNSPTRRSRPSINGQATVEQKSDSIPCACARARPVSRALLQPLPLTETFFSHMPEEDYICPCLSALCASLISLFSLSHAFTVALLGCDFASAESLAHRTIRLMGWKSPALTYVLGVRGRETYSRE